MRLPAGDIGGTKTTLVLFSPKGVQVSGGQNSFRSNQYLGLAAGAAEFLGETGLSDVQTGVRTVVNFRLLAAPERQAGGVCRPLRALHTPPNPFKWSQKQLVSELLSEAQLSIDRAVFGVAGPVAGSQATATNLPFYIIEEDLGEPWRVPESNCSTTWKRRPAACPICRPATAKHRR